jgi:hypothetical protein
MLFIDLDGYQEDIAYSDLVSIVPMIRRGCVDIIDDLIKHLKE